MIRFTASNSTENIHNVLKAGTRCVKVHRWGSGKIGINSDTLVALAFPHDLAEISTVRV